MTGYLTQLAARSLQYGATVRPRAATIFEPAGLEGHAAAAWLEQAGDAVQDWDPGPAGGPRPRSGTAVEGGAVPGPRQGPSRAGPAAAAGRPPAASQEDRGAGTAAPASRPAKGRAPVVAPRTVAAGRRARTGGGDVGSPGGDQPPEAGVHTPAPATPQAPRSLPGDAPATAGQFVAPAPDLPAEPAGVPSQQGRPQPAAGSLRGPGSSPTVAVPPAPGQPGTEPGLPLPVAARTRHARRAAPASTGDPSPSPPTVHVT